MYCQNCNKELTGYYQKKYCSNSCATTDYIKNRKGKECPHCKNILHSRWNKHIENCHGLKKEKPKKPKKIVYCMVCGKIVNIKQRKCCSDKCLSIFRSQFLLTRPVTERMREVGRLAAKKNGSGYKKGSGRGKSGWYKGIWCDSSWELAYLIYCLDHKIDIQRNKEMFVYEYNDRKYRYIPDFIVEGELVEIKGYWSEQAKAKIKQCSKPIKIIDKLSINPFLIYAKEKYGLFINLYEGK